MARKEMTNIMNRRKKGISTVLTTLIIVVASVVLGTAVTLFGTSLFQTGASQQNIAVTNTHLWFDPDDAGSERVLGAAVVRNTGDKLVAVDSIKVRGTTLAFGDWFAAKTLETADGSAITNVETTAQFIYLNSTTLTDQTAIDIDGSGTAIQSTNEPFFEQQSGPVSLEPGESVIMYFEVPGTVIGAEDVGAAATLNINAGQLTSVQSVTVANV